MEPLLKILELEQKKGYVDSAVIGGLDRFLRNWTGKATASISDPRLLNRLNHLIIIIFHYLFFMLNFLIY